MEGEGGEVAAVRMGKLHWWEGLATAAALEENKRWLDAELLRRWSGGVGRREREEARGGVEGKAAPREGSSGRLFEDGGEGGKAMLRELDLDMEVQSRGSVGLDKPRVEGPGRLRVPIWRGKQSWRE